MSDDAAPATEETVAPAAVSSEPAGKSKWYTTFGIGFNSLGDSEDTATQQAQEGANFIDILGLTGPELLGLTGPGGVLNPLTGLLDPVCLTPLAALLCSSAPGTNAAATATVKYKSGLAGSVGFGYSFDNGFRPEFALTYRQNDIESTTSTFQDTGGGNPTTITTSSEGSKTSISAMGNLWYDFFDASSTFRPYIGGGIGITQVKLKDFAPLGDDNTLSGSDEVVSYQIGAGVGYNMSPKDVLSFDYRHLMTSDASFDVGNNNTLESEYTADTIFLGYRRYFSFGKASKCPNTPEGVAVDSEGCPLDSDGDGVPDYLDKCPGTPAGAKVDANGCELDSDGDGVPDSRDQCPDTPKGTAVDEKGCPLDSDGDGVPDYLDKCPNTPAGTLVDADGCPAADQDGDGVPDYLDKCANTPKGIAVGKDGCPLDSDGDGIPDYLDECPHSPAGAKVLPNGCAPVGDCRTPRPGEEVDENGCAVEQKFILRGVKFEFDSDRLTAEAKVILDGVAVTLQNYADIKVELSGHTDNIGSDAYNLGLSERRSNSVKNYLTGKGLDAARMTPVGYGLTQPIATNDTEEGREENRRVELKVIE